MLLPGQKTRGQHNETLLHFRQSHANAHTHTQKAVLLLNTVTKQNIKNYNKWVVQWVWMGAADGRPPWVGRGRG